MKGNVTEYLSAIASSLPPEIVSESSFHRILDISSRWFSNFAASEYIMETCLDTSESEADFSFRVLKGERANLIKGLTDSIFMTADNAIWKKLSALVEYWPGDIDDIWLEFDYNEFSSIIPQPCIFFNAGNIKTRGTYNEQPLLNMLGTLIDTDQLQVLMPEINQVIHKLPPKVGLFQVGVMLSRHNDRIRVFTSELTRAQIEEYLAQINWPGSLVHLAEVIDMVSEFSEECFILDFDVSSRGVSSKIGINFGLKEKNMLPGFLQNLQTHKLCIPAKQDGVLAWSGSLGGYLGEDYGYSALIRNISHFKIALLPDENIRVKAYLRIAGFYFKQLFMQARSNSITRCSMENLNYKEIQDVIKKITCISIIDPEYRAMCLNDSQGAMKIIAGDDFYFPGQLTFVEEDGDSRAKEGFVYVLPPALKKSWLQS